MWDSEQGLALESETRGEPRFDAPGGSRRFQILALDGGGYRGVFTAAVLAFLEKEGVEGATVYPVVQPA